MDILIFCNGLITRTYLNARIENEDKETFTIIYGDNHKAIFNKNEYSYKI